MQTTSSKIFIDTLLTLEFKYPDQVKYVYRN